MSLEDAFKRMHEFLAQKLADEKGMGQERPRLPLMAYALEVVPKVFTDEEKQGLQQIGFYQFVSGYHRLTRNSSRPLHGIAGGFLMYFIYCFFEKSDGREYWLPCAANEEEQNQIRQLQCEDQKNLLRDAWRKLLKGTIHELPEDNRNWLNWLRKECWILKQNNASRIVTLNRLFYHAVKQLLPGKWNDSDVAWCIAYDTIEADRAKRDGLGKIVADDFYQLFSHVDGTGQSSSIGDIWSSYALAYLKSLKAIVTDRGNLGGVPDGWLRTICGMGADEPEVELLCCTKGGCDLCLQLKRVNELSQEGNTLVVRNQRKWFASELWWKGYDLSKIIQFNSHAEEVKPSYKADYLYVFEVSGTSGILEVIGLYSKTQKIVVAKKGGGIPRICIGKSRNKLECKPLESYNAAGWSFYSCNLILGKWDNSPEYPLFVDDEFYAWIMPGQEICFPNRSRIEWENHDVVIEGPTLRVDNYRGVPHLRRGEDEIPSNVDNEGCFCFTGLEGCTYTLECIDPSGGVRNKKVLFLPVNWRDASTPAYAGAELEREAKGGKFPWLYKLNDGTPVVLRVPLDMPLIIPNENDESIKTIYTSRDVKYYVRYIVDYHIEERECQRLYSGIPFDVRKVMGLDCRLMPGAKAKLYCRMIGDEENASSDIETDIQLVFCPKEPYITPDNRIYLPENEKCKPYWHLQMMKGKAVDCGKRSLAELSVSYADDDGFLCIPPPPTKDSLQWYKLAIVKQVPIAFSQQNAPEAAQRIMLYWDGANWCDFPAGDKGDFPIEWSDDSETHDILRAEKEAFFVQGGFSNNIIRGGYCLEWDGFQTRDIVENTCVKHHCLPLGIFTLEPDCLVKTLSLNKRNHQVTARYGDGFSRVLGDEQLLCGPDSTPEPEQICDLVTRLSIWAEEEPYIGASDCECKSLISSIAYKVLSIIPNGGKLVPYPQIHGLASLFYMLIRELLSCKPRAAELLLLALVYKATHNNLPPDKLKVLRRDELRLLCCMMRTINHDTVEEFEKFVKMVISWYIFFPYSPTITQNNYESE